MQRIDSQEVLQDDVLSCLLAVLQLCHVSAGQFAAALLGAPSLRRPVTVLRPSSFRLSYFLPWRGYSFTKGKLSKLCISIFAFPRCICSSEKKIKQNFPSQITIPGRKIKPLRPLLENPDPNFYKLYVFSIIIKNQRIWSRMTPNYPWQG